MSNVELIDRGRRQLLGGFLAAAAAVEFGWMPAAVAQAKPETNMEFPALKQIDAGVLNVGYAELGPANGAPVILLHGWPYDVHAFAEVGPLLAAKGYRVI